MLIIGNWKAYVEGAKEAKALYAANKRLAASTRKVKLVAAPPAPFLALLGAVSRSKVALAGQDVSATTVGSATGETTAAALRSAGASYAIVGHSERRAVGETDAMVADKVKRAIAAGLTPILCVGEKERDEDAHYLRTLKEQVAAVYAPLAPRDRLKIVIAYEPVWAIGKRAEDAITPRDLHEMVLYVRKVLAEFLPGKAAVNATVLYGGSVDATNIRALAQEAGVNGFLVGRASSDPSTLFALVKALK